MKIIIGLGNPGEKYENTRHNAGFLAVNSLAEKNQTTWKHSKKFNADIAEYADCLLVKPQTYMNNSGQSVRAILDYYKIDTKKDLTDVLTVIHDELDIESGKTKISVDSRSAGHNGVQSIIDHLGTKRFTRIRIGIKPPADSRIPGEKYVLAKFTPEEKKNLINTIEKLVESLK